MDGVSVYEAKNDRGYSWWTTDGKLVQVGQQAEVRVKHAFEIVGIELKKRTALIRRDECVPMQVAPVSVGRDLNFADTAAHCPATASAWI